MKIASQKSFSPKSNKAITLMVLVISIITIIILAGVTLSLVMGENGLLEKSRIAKEETQIQAYAEHIEIIRPELEVKRNLEHISLKEMMDAYEEKIKEKEQFKTSQVIRRDETTVQVITPEEYVYIVTPGGTDYIGKQGDTIPPDLQQSDITFTMIPSDWTNQAVKVKMVSRITGYHLQYSLDAVTWKEYTQEIEVKNNGTIYARLANDKSEAGGYATTNILNIDKLPPNAFTPQTNMTSSSATIIANTTDQAKTDTDGSSGIAKYYFSKDNGTTWEPNNGQISHQYVFKNLTQAKEYTFVVKAADKAGNEKISTIVKKKTEEIPDLITSNTTFSYTPSTWTNENVVVKITTSVIDYTLEYSTNGSTWTNYPATGVTMTQNGTIYARVKDSTGQVGNYATGNVANIDKLPPNNFSAQVTTTTNTATVTGETTDQAKTNENGSSGVAKYYFSKDDGATWEPNTGQSSTSYTFYNLTQSKTYHFKMKAVDKAGNEKITASITKDTQNVPGLDTSNTNFSYTPSTWTNGNVVVKIATTMSGYTIQYSVDGSNWVDYPNSGFQVGTNGTIYARIKDSTNQIGDYVTGNIANIDKLAPNGFNPSVTTKTNSATLTGSTTDQAKTNANGSSGIAKYYFSKDNGATWEPSAGQTGTSYTFNNLKQSQTYTFKMKAVDNAGNEKITGSVTNQTQKVPDLNTSNTTFTYTPSTWTNGNVVVKIATTVSGYTIQYSTDATTWKDYPSAGVTMTANGPIYARIKDSTGQIGSYATGNVTNIDKTIPQAATLSLSGAGTVTSNPKVYVTVTHKDNESNIEISKAKWVFNTNGGAIGTNSASYTGGTFTSNGQKLTIPISTNGKYYLHVLTVDKAGNARETISKAITMTINKHAHTGSTSSGGGCYTIPYYHYSYNVPVYCSGTLRYTGTSGTDHGDRWYKFKCDSCGASYNSYSSTGPVIGNGHSSISCKEWLGTVISTKTEYADGYSVPSGATLVSTSYQIGCGMNAGQIVSYTVSY